LRPGQIAALPFYAFFADGGQAKHGFFSRTVLHARCDDREKGSGAASFVTCGFLYLVVDYKA
jgi:hypothetical protein